MVTVIRKLSLETGRELVNIHFDKRLNMRGSLTKVCQNETHADRWIELHMIQAARLSIIRWTQQRLYIYSKYPAAKGAREKIDAANAILAELDNERYYNLSVENRVLITSAIYWLRGHVYKLATSEKSRYRKHYEEIIKPSIDYCFYHSKKARMRII